MHFLLSGNPLDVACLSVTYPLNFTLTDDHSLQCMTKILLFNGRNPINVMSSTGQMSDNYQVYTVPCI